jgi:uncharacterized membrane protein YeaQ/YmgE (transglycosylase-associated protein family)
MILVGIISGYLKGMIPNSSHHQGTISNAVRLGCDALSIAVFLLGKIQYRKVTTEEGTIPYSFYSSVTYVWVRGAKTRTDRKKVSLFFLKSNLIFFGIENFQVSARFAEIKRFVV